SNVGWTARAHEVGKETFPSLPPGASSSWARAARDEASRKDAKTVKARRLALMLSLLGKNNGIPTIRSPRRSICIGSQSGRAGGRTLKDERGTWKADPRSA